MVGELVESTPFDESVGELVVGELVGELVVGELVGEPVVGDPVVGELVGDVDGELVVGELVGDVVGELVVGELVVGEFVGEFVGDNVVQRASAADFPLVHASVTGTHGANFQLHCSKFREYVVNQSETPELLAPEPWHCTSNKAAVTPSHEITK